MTYLLVTWVVGFMAIAYGAVLADPENWREALSVKNLSEYIAWPITAIMAAFCFAAV